jgi:hypothetical protein
MIRGDVRFADGRQWAFVDPCLTTWEARSLSSWLHAVAAGNAAMDHEYFTEPNLSFSLDGSFGGRLSIGIRFSHEALPTWMPRDRSGWQAAEYLLVLDLSQADLAEAAEAWVRDCQPFPER